MQFVREDASQKQYLKSKYFFFCMKVILQNFTFYVKKGIINIHNVLLKPHMDNCPKKKERGVKKGLM